MSRYNVTALHESQLATDAGVEPNWDDSIIMHVQALLLLIAAGYWYVSCCTDCLRLLWGRTPCECMHVCSQLLQNVNARLQAQGLTCLHALQHHEDRPGAV